MTSTLTRTLLVTCLLTAIPSGIAVAQENCDEGMLWEPYDQVCAEVRDRQQEFWNLAIGSSNAANANPSQKPRDSQNPGKIQPGLYDDFPVPGRMSVGIAYSAGYLEAAESGRLHTRMLVHPDGLGEDSPLPLFYTTATSRIAAGLEFAGVYSSDGSGAADGLGRVGLFAWTCVPDYPCPNGSERPRWQWFIRQDDLSCHITHDVDQGGHAHKMIYYANHTDKLADDAPPLWRSALYLWNYCDAAWDLAWEHEYQQEKRNCFATNQCAFWGPAIETFSTETHPQIAEIGFEDSLLYHDGVWSELRPPEASFWDFDTNDPLPLWQLFHRDPNRSWGAGSYLHVNEPPVIEEQAQPLETAEDTPVLIEEDMFAISDPDIDPRFHVSFALTVYGGENYIRDGLNVTPDTDFVGTLTVPVTANDGGADSSAFDLLISVTPVNDPPEITGQSELEVLERTPLTIGLEHIAVSDVDSEPGAFTLTVYDGAGYSRSHNTITPDSGVIGDIFVTVSVSDGELDSEPYVLVVNVLRDEEPPVITLLGNPLVELMVGDTFDDPGATAEDNLDGDITANIVVGGDIVDTAIEGTYTITYNVTDAGGLAASEVVRTVIVKLDEPPVITMIGSSTVVLVTGEGYDERGATAQDPEDGDLTHLIVISGLVDSFTPGTYTVTYTVMDSAGNGAQAERTVIVESPSVDHPPTISLTGAATVTITEGDTYVDAGATATDAEDGDLTDRIAVDNPVDTDTPGSYTVTYTVLDSGGHAAQAQRTVIVEAAAPPPPLPVDQPPTITLNGNTTVTLTEGDSYIDEGATASDAEDGDLTDRIRVDNPVDTSRPGTYTVTYTVEDSGGNEAQIGRTVIVDAVPAPPQTDRGGGGSGGGAVSPFELLASMLMLLAIGRRQRRAATGR